MKESLTHEPIPLLDIAGEYRELRTEIDSAIRRVIDGTQFILGKEVAAFEEEFAAYCGARFAIGTNSGTSALHLALLAAGVGAGDEVITVPFTFYATVAAIGYCGAVPVYVDIDPGTFNMAAESLEAAVTPRTRAILPVHLYGQPVDLDPILDVARRHNLAVIEDAAQAHGAEYKGRRAGSIADIGCFSFYPTKNLGASGEGGMAITSNPEFARKMRMLRDWGQEQKYRPVLKGFNYRLEGLQGAILREKLKHLDRWTEHRRTCAAFYDAHLNSSVVIPRTLEGVRHAYHLYTVRVLHRDAVQHQLQAAGIQTAVHYPVPIHLLPAYADARYAAGDFPASEDASKSVLSLPLHPRLTMAQIGRVCTVLNNLNDNGSSGA
ncbi:MAG TPA: DegT/DnrJ/EryC1/StrS family aminotransferase [Bryobacteraceae bacterium]|jgi:dTDP-4-amino-4,6-dideoxygalactose transaminase|nr:DegT/DnrJ/EryC1/StrS family aminotransferase [Bryobacteraceae bacterium]